MDKGLNTGGMGVFAPVPGVSQDLLDLIRETLSCDCTARDEKAIDYVRGSALCWNYGNASRSCSS